MARIFLLFDRRIPHLPLACQPNMPAKFSCSLALLLAAIASPAALAVDRDVLAAASASISKSELKNYVDVLADDTFEGRESGSRGGRAAANYILKLFEQLGAAPAGDSGTYFQSFQANSRNVLGFVEGGGSGLPGHRGWARAAAPAGPAFRQERIYMLRQLLSKHFFWRRRGKVGRRGAA